MPFRCCAPNCRGNYPSGPKVSLFNFPKDKDLNARWVQAIKRQEKNGEMFVPTASSKVCELHFHEQDILRFTTTHDEKTGKILKASLKYPRLAPGSVPFRVLNISSPVQKELPRREAPSEKKARLDSERLERPTITTHAQLSQSTQQTQQLMMGTKRGRFLMRQPRIKRESDSCQHAESDPLSPHFLTVPHLRVERQCSDPLPTISPPPGNLLSVPGNVLVKQHSHPLLPSQMHQHQSSTPPMGLHIQLLPQSHSNEGERSSSPILVASDPLAVGPHDISTSSRTERVQSETLLRVRTDELRRSSSSPQACTRSSHCPMIRSGPALGCNYCWNTVDTHGRILRRKTKYHCPECQTNLCIVPCFQEYHERHVSSGQADPITLTTSVMKVFPKTSSI